MSDQAVASSRMIGEIFVERGLVTREQLNEALAIQAREGGLIGEILVGSFGVSRVELATVLAEQWRAIDNVEREQGGAPGAVSAPSEPTIVTLPSPDPDTAERRPIGEIFVSTGAITQDDLDRALLTQRETGERLGEILVAQGSIGRLELASALAEQWSELQVIRPPQPKRPEPWQETAVRAAGQPAEVGPTAQHPASEELAELARAVGDLEQQVRQLAGRELPDVDAVRAEASALAERLERVEAEVGESVDRSALAHVVESVDRLRAEVEKAHAGLVAQSELLASLPALSDRLDTLAERAPEASVLASVEAAVAELAERSVDPAVVAELQARLAELAARAVDGGSLAELQARVVELAERSVDPAVVAEFEARLAELAERAPEASVLASVEARVVELAERSVDPAVVAELQARLAELAARAVDGGSLAELQARVVELAERSVDPAVVAGLEARLAELAARAVDGGSLAELQARLAELAARAVDGGSLAELQARVVELAERSVDPAVVAGLEARLAELAARAVDGGSLAELQARLVELAERSVDPALVAELQARLAELAARAVDGGSLAELQARVAELAERSVDPDGLARLEASLAELADRVSSDGVRAAQEMLVARLEALEQEAGPTRIDAVWTALETMQRRLDAPAVASDEVRATLDELRSRLDEVSSTIDVAPHAERLAALESVVADRSALDEISTRLDVLARGAARSEDVEALREALARDVEALRSALAASAPDELETRFSEFRDALAELERHVDAREDQEVAGRLDETRSVLDDLAGRLDAVLARVSSTEADTAAATRLAHDLEGRLEQLAPIDRVSALEDRLAGSGSEVDDRLAAVERTVAELPISDLRRELERAVGEIDGRIAMLGERLDTAVPGREDVDRVAGELRSLLDGMQHRLDEVRASVDEVPSVLDDRLAETVTRVELVALTGDVRARLDDLASALDAAVDGRRVDELEARVDELDDRAAKRIGAATTELARSLEERLTGTTGRIELLEQLVAEASERASSAAAEVREEFEPRFADVASRAELGALAGELGARAGTSEAATERVSRRLDEELAAVWARLDEAGRSAAPRSELQQLAGAIEARQVSAEEALAETAARSAEAAGAARAAHERLDEAASRGELSEVWGRVVGAESGLARLSAELDQRLAVVAGREEVERRLAEGIATTSTQLSDLLEARLAEVAGRLAGLDETITALDARSGTVADAIQQGVEARLVGMASSADVQRLRSELEELLDLRLVEADERQDARLGGVAGELQQAIAELHGRVDEVAAGLGHTGGRLVAVEQAVPEAGLVEALRERVETVHGQMAEEIALGEQRAKATERALRKGLAELGERLVASEHAYVEAGSALRRSIERLGAAVVEADARIAGEPLDAPGSGYVAFLPTTDGYRLTALAGPVPALDAIVEVDGVDGQHRVTRVTRSPLPLDRRPCVYLESVS